MKRLRVRARDRLPTNTTAGFITELQAYLRSSWIPTDTRVALGKVLAHVERVRPDDLGVVLRQLQAACHARASFSDVEDACEVALFFAEPKGDDVA